MARIAFSPLIVSASGKVKDTVFSKWKGRAYIRARVTPANPKSAAQVLVRNSLSRCVDMWQSFEAQLKAAWDEYASPYSFSGYNGFMKLNRAAEQAGTDIETSALNSDIAGVSDLSAATGASGAIDLTWTDPGMGAGYNAYVLVRKTATDAWVVAEKDTTLMSAGAVTISGLTVATLYEVTICTELTASHDFSISDYDTATTGA